MPHTCLPHASKGPVRPDQRCTVLFMYTDTHASVYVAAAVDSHLMVGGMRYPNHHTRRLPSLAQVLSVNTQTRSSLTHSFIPHLDTPLVCRPQQAAAAVAASKRRHAAVAGVQSLRQCAIQPHNRHLYLKQCSNATAPYLLQQLMQHDTRYEKRFAHVESPMIAIWAYDQRARQG